MKKILLLGVLFCLVVTVSGCETFRGLGQDIENTGENIKEAVGRI